MAPNGVRCTGNLAVWKIKKKDGTDAKSIDLEVNFLFAVIVNTVEKFVINVLTISFIFCMIFIFYILFFFCVCMCVVGGLGY